MLHVRLCRECKPRGAVILTETDGYTELQKVEYCEKDRECAVLVCGEKSDRRAYETVILFAPDMAEERLFRLFFEGSC